MAKSYRIPLVATQVIVTGEVEYYTNEASRIDDLIGLIDKYVAEKIWGSGVEHFGIIAVDNKDEIIGIANLSRGTARNTVASPKEVIKAALVMNAASIVLYHNHPRDNADPSVTDIETTNEIIALCRQLDIEVLDHYIRGKDRTISMYRQGYIE